MKRQRMTVKRRPVKKGAVRTLFAKVNRKKRQRAATASAAAGDIEGDVPNIGVARALVVILIIHVVAIAGIFFHSRWLDDDQTEVAVATATESPKAKPIDEPVRDEPDLPKFKSGDSVYTVGAGDTYENIASRFGVTENELRLANDNIAIRAGRYLRIPKKTIVAVESAEIAALRDPSASVDPVVLETVSPVPPSPAPVVEQPAAPPLVATEAARRADAIPGSPEAAASTYLVKPGDTFWSIARKHGSSVDSLMKANGISDARRLRVGMNLTIPR